MDGSHSADEEIARLQGELAASRSVAEQVIGLDVDTARQFVEDHGLTVRTVTGRFISDASMRTKRVTLYSENGRVVEVSVG